MRKKETKNLLDRKKGKADHLQKKKTDTLPRQVFQLNGDIYQCFRNKKTFLMGIVWPFLFFIGFSCHFDRGVDINAKDKDGRTPLHYASREGKQKVAALLIEKGVDINAKDKNGKNTSPLCLTRRKTKSSSSPYRKGC